MYRGFRGSRVYRAHKGLYGCRLQVVGLRVSDKGQSFWDEAFHVRVRTFWGISVQNV